MQRKLTFLFICFFILLLWGTTALSRESPGAGGYALDFTISYLFDESKELTFSHYYGAKAKDPKKAIILTFFGSWCKPCIQELPILEALYKKHKEHGLLVINVSVDKGEANKTKELIKKAKVTFPVLHDSLQVVMERYGVVHLPKMFVIDGSGKVVKIFVGMNESKKAELEGEIENLLNK